MRNDYEDGSGCVLNVHPCWPGPAVEIATPKGTVYVSQEAALGIALDLLEKTDNTVQGLARHADALQREAEDVKARDYYDATSAAGSPIWADLTENSRQNWRDHYAASRDYFKES